MRTAIFAVQFFNWYQTTPETPLSQLEKTWTFRPSWDRLGVRPEEIGHTEGYYRQQFDRIRAAGFDALLWEWHNPAPEHDALREARSWPYRGGTPPAAALGAARTAGLRIGMFYDLEIRWAGLPGFLSPVRPMAECIVRDVQSFYADIPEDLRLVDRDGRIPVVFYGYQFAGGGTVQAWDLFFRQVTDGLMRALGREPVLHWTDAGRPEQAYGFQHFPSIRPFTFNPCHPQSALGADSVTFCLAYDDYGVWRGNTEAPGPREHDLIIDDPRLVEEGLALAQVTDPSLVFFYGWNELYEGEGLIPDEVHGDARLELAAGILRALDTALPGQTGPAATVVSDDLLPLARRTPGLAQRQIQLLQLLRTVLPGARCGLPGTALGQGPVVYTTVAPPPPAEAGQQVAWLAPAGASGAAPGSVALDATGDPATAVLEAARALDLPVRPGVLLAPDWIRVSPSQVESAQAGVPTCLPAISLPVDQVVLAPARALPEEAMRLPTGWATPRFRWLRGTPRPLVMEEGSVRLRYPEVLEVHRA